MISGNINGSYFQVYPYGEMMIVQPSEYYYVQWLPSNASGTFTIGSSTYNLSDYNGYFDDFNGEIGEGAFRSNSELTYIGTDVSYIGSEAFAYCTSLSTFYISGYSVCLLENSNAFSGTGITPSTGYIYVPVSLLGSYRSASEWSYFYNRISVMNTDFYVKWTPVSGWPSTSSTNYSRNYFTIDSVSHKFYDYSGEFSGFYGELGYSAFYNTSVTTIDTNALMVGPSTFYLCRLLNSVSLSCCTSIGSRTFDACSLLSDVYLPECEYVGIEAFEDCMSLSSINLPKCSTISTGAFYMTYSADDKPNLRTVSIPNCYFIGPHAFYNCCYLSSVYMPQCLSVGGYAFKGCNLVGSIDLQNCIYVGNEAFDGDGIDGTGKNIITGISLPVCEYVGSDAFRYCYCSVIDLPQCRYVGSGAFIGSDYSYLSTSDNLVSVNLPKCSYLGNTAFAYRSKISSVSLPVCEYVGNRVFERTRFYSLNLPRCSYIGTWAFRYAYIYYITLGNSSVCEICSDTFEGTGYQIFVPSSLVDAYKSAQYWSSLSSRIFPIE